jgi:hypothetical protein
MKNKLFIFFAFAVLSACLAWCPESRAEMIKEVAIGVFHTAPNEAEMEKYYLSQHGPTIALASGPWMRRYRLWLPYTPPEEAVEKFGALRGRYAELWYPGAEDFIVTHGGAQQADPEMPPPEMPTGISETGEGPVFQSPLPWERRDPSIPKANNPVVIVPAIATENFHSTMGPMELADTTFLRWVTVIKYPEGVSVEEGEKWFLEVYAKEASKQPGLLNFFSHKCISGVKRLDPGEKEWVRVVEYWYDDFDAWENAVIKAPPGYTKPSWGGEYPFVEMVSTFIPYMHYVDFLKGDYVVP